VDSSTVVCDDIGAWPHGRREGLPTGLVAFCSRVVVRVIMTRNTMLLEEVIRGSLRH